MKKFEDIVIEQLTSLNNNLTEFKQQTNQRFEKIDQRFEKIDQRFEEVDQRFENLEQEFTKQISKLNRSIVLLEDKVSTEIPALFDGYKLNRELLEDRDEKISYLTIKTEENSIRISALEEKMNAL